MKIPARLLVSASMLLGSACATPPSPGDSSPPATVRETPRQGASYDAEIAAKVNALLARMTLDEKVAQLCTLCPGGGGDIASETPGVFTREFLEKCFGENGIGSVCRTMRPLTPAEGAAASDLVQEISAKRTRLGIPPLMAEEALHGLGGKGATCFPQPIALASTWNPELVGQIGTRIGLESRARGVRAIKAPVLDLARDTRHGRAEETYGEDPLLASRLGVAFVRGAQSSGIACVLKHFAANYVGDGGRDSTDIELSEKALRETHLEPFRAAVQEGGALGIMCSYNAINGMPVACNRWLLTDVLRTEWGFHGFVISDASAVNHVWDCSHAASTPMGAARRCVRAGMDSDNPRLRYYAKLGDEVRAGRLDEKDVDACVRHILEVKFRIGLFENPMANPTEAVRLAEHPDKALSLEAARQSIVLLKNKGEVLPIPAATKRIAAFGPCADWVNLGGYTASGGEGPTPLAALKKQFGTQAEIVFAKGCGLKGGKDAAGDAQLAEAAKLAQGADLCVIFAGGATGVTGGESSDRTTLDLAGRQEELIETVARAAAGKPVVVVLTNGTATVMKNWIDRVDAVLCPWYGGSEGATAIAEALAGKVNPSGHLPVSFPKATGQLPMTYDMRRNGREGSYYDLSGGKRVVFRYDPQFPFGYGLSYTTFAYGRLSVSPKQIPVNGKVTVSIRVTNTGKVAGDEVAQLYLSDDYCRLVPFNRRLRAFKRVSLKPGESRDLSFDLDARDFAFINEKNKPEVEPGSFTVHVGGNCRDVISEKFRVGDGEPD